MRTQTGIVFPLTIYSIQELDDYVGLFKQSVF